MIKKSMITFLDTTLFLWLRIVTLPERFYSTRHENMVSHSLQGPTYPAVVVRLMPLWQNTCHSRSRFNQERTEKDWVFRIAMATCWKGTLGFTGERSHGKIGPISFSWRGHGNSTTYLMVIDFPKAEADRENFEQVLIRSDRHTLRSRERPL
jgi:hypothetical protein